MPEAYLKALAAYKGNDKDLVTNWIANAKNNADRRAEQRLDPGRPQATLRDVLFLERSRSGARAGGGRRPGGAALGDRRTMRPYDGALGYNYLHWLISASGADLQNERFVGADGKLVPPPEALLYKLLRVASARRADRRQPVPGHRACGRTCSPAAPAMPPTANISGPSLMPAHYTMLDTAKMGLTTVSQTAGDYLLAQARSPTAILQKPPEAAPLAALTDALRVLADLPTARLERLFAEHVDTVLLPPRCLADGLLRAAARQRAAVAAARRPARTWAPTAGSRTSGRRRRDSRSRPNRFPRRCTSPSTGRSSTYTDNGGFVHAPSLPHAVTAAVLRNAYLTHAEPAVADRMAVNLSSARVRTALRYIEGLQNGQELAALLGYQLERGLHEGHPGVELDRFIYPLARTLPADLEEADRRAGRQSGRSHRSAQRDQRLRPARLREGQVLSLRARGAADRPAGIRRQRSRARRSSRRSTGCATRMDAIADLLLAESVHQVVQGNYARARGAIQALTDGELPPIPDVIQTPRTGKSLTHRVALCLAPGATAGWHATLTPRARANAALNHWLAAVLPAPGAIHWQVKQGTAVPVFVSLATPRPRAARRRAHERRARWATSPARSNGCSPTTTATPTRSATTSSPSPSARPIRRFPTRRR